MKITDDVLKALQTCIDSIGSKNAFARKANVHINTVSKYLTRRTRHITDETWEKLHPLLKPYMGGKNEIKGFSKAKIEAVKKLCNVEDLTSNEKILLDAFALLPRELQDKKLIEIVELASKQIQNNQR